MVPSLQNSRDTRNNHQPPPQKTDSFSTSLISIFDALSFYFQNPAFLPSFSLSLLYLTVLSFGGQMVTYLLSTGYTSVHIGLLRTLSVGFEISATWIGPKAIARIGPIRTGIWFINWQVTCLAGAVVLFWGMGTPMLSATGLVIGVMLSRVGLWGFDLSAQTIIQEVLATLCSFPNPVT